jgi:hypothetical protein
MANSYQLCCPCCSKVFIASHARTKWCSSACRRRAYERRRRGYPIADQHVTLEQPLEHQHQSTIGHDCRTWQGTAIQRRQSDGYVNATAMCQANGREWFTYARSARTQEYIAALKAVPQICGTELVVSVTGGTPSLQGTWIHPRLAVDLARWISPAFAVWMDGWFLESLQRPAQPALATGIHVVAPSRREAFRMWNQTLATEFVACMSDVLPIGHNQPTPLLIHTHPHTD